MCTGSCSTPRQGLPGERQDPPWFLWSHSRTKYLISGDKAPTRGACREGQPRHSKELAATRHALRKATRPRQEELAGKTNQGTSRPGERQASGPDKITAAARRLPRQAATLCPRSSASTNVSLWGPLQARVAGGCAASGAQWHAKLTRSPSWRTVAPLTVLFCTVRVTQTGI